MTIKRTLPLWMFLVSILGLTVTFALVVVAIVRIDQRDEREDDQEALDLNYLNCLRGNEVRYGQIENELEPGTPIDLTILPSVQGAPEWFRDVAAELKTLSEMAASSEPAPGSRADRRIARIAAQIRDCEREWAGHTTGLRLPHEPTPPPRILERYGATPEVNL